jgi:hypothetical protein
MKTTTFIIITVEQNLGELNTVLCPVIIMLSFYILKTRRKYIFIIPADGNSMIKDSWDLRFHGGES